MDTSDNDLPEHVQANRWVIAEEPPLGVRTTVGDVGRSNTEAPLLTDSLSVQDAIELGGGTSYVSGVYGPTQRRRHRRR